MLISIVTTLVALLPATLLSLFTVPFACVKASSRYVQSKLVHLLLEIIASGPVPRHIAFEMDGNRRFARAQGREGREGHSDGFQALLCVLDICLRLRIRCVTVYAFAIENFNRPKDEVDALMKLAEERLVEIAEKGHILDKYGVRLNVLGKRELLPPNVQTAVDKAERMTRRNNTAILNVCAPYASQHEITTAVESAIRAAIDAGDFEGSTLTEHTIASHLFTSLAGSPPLDVFVRTSGVKRLSGFLTWQCNEDTQIHMVPTYWPNFGLRDLIPILLEYQRNVWAKSKRSEHGLSDAGKVEEDLPHSEEIGRGMKKVEEGQYTCAEHTTTRFMKSGERSGVRVSKRSAEKRERGRISYGERNGLEMDCLMPRRVRKTREAS
ncbi:putative undecaprenyl diphosphate synthase-domain-containing protein [Phlebopus sp. FC_14]|nr:putative undecaprenyl diphosphate synthase-domain-containing protein [Phlebopus sp. FC_14]